MPQTSNDQSLPFYVTVRRNDGPRKFYSGAADRQSAEIIAASRNAVEVELRKRRAADNERLVANECLYIYEVQQR